MKTSGDWLTAPSAQAVLRMLEGGGHRALAVGGCVRNALLGVPVNDVDVATDARPGRVAELAEAAGLRAVPTGIAHGTVTVVAGGAPYEVTTFRRDVATDGRHAVVAFSDEVAEDAARRDFTMNALYVEPDGTVVDPLGGLPDLLARRVRFVGDADARVREDYLRVLRFFRFHAWYADPAGGLDADALDACARGADGLGRLSAERIGGEMARLLAAPDPAPAVAAMAASGVLARIMPGAGPEALAPLIDAEGALPPDWRRRAAALGGEVGGWRLSRADARAIEVRRAALEAGVPVHEVAYRHGAEAARDVALIRADGAATDLRGIEAAARERLPLRAADLPLEGPALGDALRRAEAAWIASGFALTVAELRALALSP